MKLKINAQYGAFSHVTRIIFNLNNLVHYIFQSLTLKKVLIEDNHI